MTVPRVVTVLLLAVLALPGGAAATVRVAARDVPLAPAARAPAAAARVLPARAAPFRFNLVGVHWRGSGTVAFRTASADKGWSLWRDARPEGEDAPDAGSAEAAARRRWKLGNPYWTGPARRIQYRLSGRVTRLRAHFVWSAPRRGRTLALARKPAIVRRAAWGADETIVRDRPTLAPRLAFAVVHHTAGASPSSRAESAAIVRGIQAYHVRGNGWDDIGYNFLVDRFGQVFEGRGGGIKRNVVGAHAQGFNTGSVGVAVLGSYGSRTISGSARDALVALLAWRLDVAHVDPGARVTWLSGGNPRFAVGVPVSFPTAVAGHRDTGWTSCPGDALYRNLLAIAADTRARALPKLWEPDAAGSVGGPVRFTARLSTALDWTVTITDAAGTVVASGSGSGQQVDWTWEATEVPPGRYRYRIAAPGARAATGRVASPPPLALADLAVRPRALTPNGDGVGERARVTFALTAPATVTASLHDATGAEVATVLPPTVAAAGEVSRRWKSPSALADGRYTLVVEAEAGKERRTATAEVTIDRTLGHLAVRPAAFSPNGDNRLDLLTVAFDLTQPARVRVRAVQRAQRVTLFAGDLAGGGRQTLTWDGRVGGEAVREGRYRVVVSALGPLGRRALSRPIAVDTTRPVVSRLRARRRGGRVVARFRLDEPARLVVRVGTRIRRVDRQAGSRVVRLRARGRHVRVVARDPAGNASRPARARIRRSR